MKRFLIPLACLLLLSATAATVLRAEDASDKPAAVDPAKLDKKIARMKNKLSLTDDQAAKLKDAWMKEGPALKAAGQKLKKGLKQLRDQVKAKAPDADVAKTLDELKADRENFRAEQAKAEASAETILTPTQRAKIVLHMAHQRRRWFRWLHRG